MHIHVTGMEVRVHSGPANYLPHQNLKVCVRVFVFEREKEREIEREREREKERARDRSERDFARYSNKFSGTGHGS